MKNKHLISAPILGALLCPGASPAQEPAVTAGERLFRTRCASCHSLNPGENRVGPHLSGLVGRSAGSVEGARYSKALSIAIRLGRRASARLLKQSTPGCARHHDERQHSRRGAAIGDHLLPAEQSWRDDPVRQACGW
jgi:cytochrome c